MKEANHNAVDLLLSSLARGEKEEPRPGEESVMASNHLDADELNLYAENALSAPARARYTDHLADCPRCRRIVAGLAQAAGRTIRDEPISQPLKLGFWHRFGALFSAPVVRYALPAVLLTGILGIAFIALREQRNDLVARNERPAVFDQRGESAGTTANSAVPQTELQNQQAEANKAPSEPKNSPIDNMGPPAQKPESSTEDKTTVTSSVKEAPPPSVVGAVTQPSFAPEPPPPPKAVELDTKSRISKDGLELEAQKRREDEGLLLSKDDSPKHGPARSRAMSSARGRDADAPAENRAVLKDKKNADEEVETRTVSGRHFRRQGDAWVDTAYESSRSITNVSRGSDQFRALMADEPGLRAIVQQLGGEVKVVWKNRAYRIR